MFEKKLNNGWKLPLTLNIQLFADNDGNVGGVETPKTYTQEEMDKIISERDKYKKANDDLSKENADYKRKQKEKMTQEEQELEAQKIRDKEYEDMKRELNSSKMSKELSNCGLEEKDIEKIVNSLNDNDLIESCKLISSVINAQIEKIKKQNELDNQRKSIYPPQSSKDNNKQLSSFMQKRLEEKKRLSGLNNQN